MTDLVVGNVISIEGTYINALMHDNTNVLNYYHNGVYYSGITVGVYVGIIRGPYKIVCMVEKEYLTDIGKNVGKQSYEIDRFERNIQMRIVGTFLDGKFILGIKSYPMVYNEVVLLSHEELAQLIQPKKSNYSIHIGETLDGVEALIDVTKLFNTHMGIFGNTGSGKSNTLAKLYSSLFELDGTSIKLENKSTFVFIDFNGEYSGRNILTNNKKVLKLSTRKSSGNERISLSNREFWDIETLSILFSATEKTQQPFLNSAINYYKEDGVVNLDSSKIIDAIGSGFYNTFKSNNNKETLNLLRKVYDLSLKDSTIDLPWGNALWHAGRTTFYLPDKTKYASELTDANIYELRQELQVILRENSDKLDRLDNVEKLLIIVYLRLIYGLAYGHIQFEHVNPLIQRIESRSITINKLIELSDNECNEMVQVISLKDCNVEAKKIIPLLLAKQYYNKHKEKTSNDEIIKETFNFIVDEAHNILSSESNREESTWKDYRLEVFEEIIKEGRKFGFFLTISSQRPSDISPTIISQLHNYFLHRLVNENDIKMISNTINSLDGVSKQNIPNLAPGQCVITGTSFDLPIIVQIEQLIEGHRPNSDNANLSDIWDTSF